MNPPFEPAATPRGLILRMPPKGQSIVASSAILGWEGIHAAVLEGRIEEFFDLSAAFPIVLFVLKGAAQLEWRRGNRFSRLGVKPGDVLIAPPCDFNRLRSNLAIEVLCCPIDLEILCEMAEREWPPGGSAFEVVEGVNRSDEDLWALGRRLADQLLTPIPGSRPYARAIQAQVAIHLLWNYSTLPRPGESDEGLADHRLRQVVEYIQQNLGEDVSLDTLAGVAGLSPNYFLGAFRQATGRTPHRYVTELRIARACELLHDPRRPISEVSLAVGFSSQSHMTEVFRRTMNTTPAAYRREILGLARNGERGPSAPCPIEKTGG